MTTILICGDRKRNNGKIQVFGSYAGDDDRFVFGIRSFDDAGQAERYAGRLVAIHQADRLERTDG